MQQRQYRIINIALLTSFIVMLLISAALSWYKYIYTKNFRFVTDEHNIPKRFDIKTY